MDLPSLPPAKLAQPGQPAALAAASLSALPVLTPTAPVPVYNCHVILRGPSADGTWEGRVTNLPEITALAGSERELLRLLVDRFKGRLKWLRQTGEVVPWNTSVVRPSAEEQQRWISVHL